MVSNWAKEFDKWVGRATQPKRVVIRKGGEEGLRSIKGFVPVKAKKPEGMFMCAFTMFFMYTIYKGRERLTFALS